MPNEIDIYDDIGGEGMNVAEFDRQLKALGPVKEITLNMHSYGGSITEGFGIAELIEKHPARFTCNILGAAMSMGSVIPMSCDEVVIAPNAMMMIHDSRGGGDGMQADEMVKQSEMLKHYNEQMALAYQKKSQQPIETIREMMKAETWLTPQKAVELGFANRVADKSFVIAAISKLLPVKAGVTKPVLEGLTKMSDTKTPATVKQLKAEFPNASAAFIVEAAEKEMTFEEASKAYFKAMEKENEDMKARLSAMDDEKKKEEEAKAKAMEMEEEEKESKAKAKASGTQPVAHASGPPAGMSAKARWAGAVQAKVSAGIPRQKAVIQVETENPELRAAMIQEVNPRG